MTNYSTVQNSEKTELPDTDQSVAANAAKAAVRNVVDGGVDPTGGARFWDGTDFLVWGLNSPTVLRIISLRNIRLSPFPLRFLIFIRQARSGGMPEEPCITVKCAIHFRRMFLTIPQTGCRKSPFHLFRFQIYSVTSVSFDTSPTARDGDFMRRAVTDCRFLEIGLG